jgi:hypothetical protein
MKERDIKPRLFAICVYLLLLTVAVLVSTGCGGASKAAPAGTRHPDGSTSRFIAGADAICKRLNAELTPNTSAHLSGTELARSTLRNAALERAVLARLSKLTVPASLADGWKQLLSDRRTLVAELVMLAQSVKSNDTEKLHALAVSKFRLHQKLRETASRDGFKDCSHVGPLLPTGGSQPPTPSQAQKIHATTLSRPPNRAPQAPA